MNEKQVMTLLDACYHEFCDIVGDSPCGCECCPYSEYTMEENENGCYELNLKNFGFNIYKIYVSEDYNEVMENILETLDKSAYVRMQFITRHFSIVSTLLRNRA